MKKQAAFNPQILIGAVIAFALLLAIGSVVMSDLFGAKGSGLSEEFTYDLETLIKTDPALLMYEESAPRIDSGFEWARSIAVDREDRIYITSKNTVHSFTSSGQKTSFEINVDHEISSIAIANDGRIYLGVNDHIEIFNPEGNLQTRWEPISLKTIITSIAIGDNDIFVADFGNRAVHRFDLAGNRKLTFGDFVIPSFYFDLAIAGDDDLKVAHTGEHRIETYDFDGNMDSFWGSFSMLEPDKFSGCCNPISFAMLPDGGFVTCEKGIVRMKVYDPKGEFLGYVAGGEEFNTHDVQCKDPDSCFSPLGLDVAVDSKGRVLALEPSSAQVRIYGKTNQ